MFLTNNDYQAFYPINFPLDQELRYEKFAMHWKNYLKTHSSLSLCSFSERKVTEGQLFWRAAGNLIAGSFKLEKLE